MNIFKVHSQIIDQYSKYISSFIEIADSNIRSKVEDYFSSHKLWPQPLIQFNPAYEKSESINELCNSGLLNNKLRNVFSGYELYKHQVEALNLGTVDKNFIVTSGTGSGKSLTYIGTIFNHLFNQQKKGKGTKALIVYPMNALINSQLGEFNKYKERFEKSTGTDFPITYARYTGQESREDKDKIIDELPDIILTNYMMLELIMTRIGEKRIRESLFEHLKYLVFDELHTYRGRQGSDVSMLIRRIHSKTRNKLVCIGTSATMAAGDTLAEQKEQVAIVATKFFGTTFSEDQVIDEKLISSIEYGNREINTKILTQELQDPVNKKYSFEELKKSELVYWLENQIALEEIEGRLVRRKPMAIQEISEKLAGAIEVDEKLCMEHIENILIQANELNKTLESKEESLLPFKIHQFISQTGSVLTTLEDKDRRILSFESSAFINDDDGEKIPLFPIVFSRISGVDFICVAKNTKEEKLFPREFRQRYSEDENIFDVGYIILDAKNELWKEEDISSLPDTWFKMRANGSVIIKKEYEKNLPQKIYFDKKGNYSYTSGSLPNEGWYLAAPILFDPTSGVFYDRKTSEGTKLSKLGVEGRSTATTILSFSTISALAAEEQKYSEQKLLSFTDNRQDAALQAGHFNDFYKVSLLRSAIYHAIRTANDGQLDHSQIAQSVFTTLALEQEQYAKSPSPIPFQAEENRKAFENILMYRILYDLKKGWRVTLPNLEQCGLLRIEYKYLKETIEYEQLWTNVPLLNLMPTEDKKDFIIQTLDYFRKNYALSYPLFDDNEISRIEKIIRAEIIPEWGLEKNEDIDIPSYLRVETLSYVKSRIYTVSLGAQSYFGKYVKIIAKKYEFEINKDNYKEVVYSILDSLEKAKWLESKPINQGERQIKIYRLTAKSIIWKVGDGENIVPDKVRLQSYKDYKPKVNKFFKEFYSQNFANEKRMEAREHTAQITNEDRQDREKKFQDGDISLLCCSPTMELGIDISTLNVVHMRNVPPNPANYAQRSGRAGRSGQAALVMTFCSNFSPHDKHYFDNPKEMVAGVVKPAKIDLINEELLSSHLYAVLLSEVGISELENSIGELLDLDDLVNLSLKASIYAKLNINSVTKQEIFANIKAVVNNFEEQLSKSYWYNDDWIRRQIEKAPEVFDKALDRWRELYRSANRQLNNAQEIINNPAYTNKSKEKRAAYAEQMQANKQMDLLRNDLGASRQFSEFYPFRYLASEGFLPGYNFTRLPIRTFIPKGEDAEFISRARFLALREFGPGNIIYHNGSKYQIKQLIQSEAESKIKKIKIAKGSGYALMDEDYDKEYCPFTNVHLKTDDEREIFTDLLELSENRAMQRERISSDEEERLTMGYDIRTYFTVSGGMDRVKTVHIKDGEDSLLKIRYIPAATLIKINHKWTARKDPGFLINIKTGIWKKGKADPNNEDDIANLKRVRLFTTDTADALYIHPLPALAFEKGKVADGIITLQFGLKRAIETVFQVESNEIGVEVLGDPENPNMLIYEASEGSLGILSQIVESPELFKSIVKEAYSICHFKDGEDTEPDAGPASYSNLLSYYNQIYHQRIDRHYIKDQLEKLMICDLEVMGKSNFDSYDEQYDHLLERIDPNSSTELQFIKYLKKYGLKLPDVAQYNVDDIYVKPDFYYEEENAVIFCDGTPHDDPNVKKQDQIKREALTNNGYDVIVYYYKDSLDKLVEDRSDVFKKVK